MAKYIEIVNGQEVSTEKGKGRTRLGFVKDVSDGNYRRNPDFDMSAHRSAQRPERQEHFYITFDAQGNEISRKVAGKGRPANGFTQQVNGDFHKTETPAPVVTPVITTNEVSAPVTQSA